MLASADPQFLLHEPLWEVSPRGLSWFSLKHGVHVQGQASQEKEPEDRSPDPQHQMSGSITSVVATVPPDAKRGRETLSPPRGVSVSQGVAIFGKYRGHPLAGPSLE